jgi:hypothetical protein
MAYRKVLLTSCVLVAALGLGGAFAETAAPAKHGAPAARAAARSDFNGVWLSRNKALPEGPAAGFPMQLSQTDWVPLSAGRIEDMPIESLEHQKAAVEKVIANNGDVFVYEASRRKPPPYTAAGQKPVDEMRAARAAGGAQRNPYDQCLPRNAVGFGGTLELFVAKDHVGVISEQGGSYRTIHTGGVDRAKLTPTYDGVSIGRWEGDRLVVVTTDYLGDTANGWPMSQTAKVTDTFWLSKDKKTLNIKSVYEDPANLKEPVARMTYLDRAPGAYQFLTNNCVESVQGAAEYAKIFGNPQAK